MIVTNNDISFEYIYNQSLPSSEWVIIHSLGCHPVVTVIDSSGNQVEGDVIYNSINQITISAPVVMGISDDDWTSMLKKRSFEHDHEDYYEDFPEMKGWEKYW